MKLCSKLPLHTCSRLLGYYSSEGLQLIEDKESKPPKPKNLQRPSQKCQKTLTASLPGIPRMLEEHAGFWPRKILMKAEAFKND